MALKNFGFPKSITMPISLHVKAKRYVHTVNTSYKLIDEPIQCGKMTEEEMYFFEKNPYFEDAILLNRADISSTNEIGKYAPMTIYDFQSEIKAVLEQ